MEESKLIEDTPPIRNLALPTPLKLQQLKGEDPSTRRKSTDVLEGGSSLTPIGEGDGGKLRRATTTLLPESCGTSRRASLSPVAGFHARTAIASSAIAKDAGPLSLPDPGSRPGRDRHGQGALQSIALAPMKVDPALSEFKSDPSEGLYESKKEKDEEDDEDGAGTPTLTPVCSSPTSSPAESQDELSGSLNRRTRLASLGKTHSPTVPALMDDHPADFFSPRTMAGAETTRLGPGGSRRRSSVGGLPLPPLSSSSPVLVSSAPYDHQDQSPAGNIAVSHQAGNQQVALVQFGSAPELNVGSPLKKLQPLGPALG